MNLLFTIIISLLFSFVAILMLKKEKSNKKYTIVFATIIFVGVFIRLYRIDVYPIGLNQDEASIGYEALNIFKYGIDRFGMTYPVHLISWGSGQNALYAYLIMPFIKIIFNDILLIRFPMAIFGCISLLFILYFIKKECPNNTGIIILLLFAIMPWHIMKSRWALESNIFPDIVLYGLIFLYFGIKNNKNYLNIIASIIFGISTYAYGTSYLYIPLLLIIIYSYLIIKKEITIKKSLLYFLITGIVALPMIMFVIINYFDLNTIKILNITIPKLYYNRFTTITSVNGNFFINCLNNLINSLRIIITEYDNLPLNSIKYFGLFYTISLPFLIYGIVIYFKKYKNNLYLELSFISLITGLIVAMMVDPNINRINFLWFPIYIFIILGIIDICKKSKYIKIIIILIYVISFIFFINYYFNKYQDSISYINNEGLKDAIIKVTEQKNIYITESINQPYIFWLYYKKISPNYYIDNRIIENENVMFQRINSIGNVYFYIPNNYELIKDNTYIIPESDINRYDTNNCIINKYTNFIVLDC